MGTDPHSDETDWPSARSGDSDAFARVWDRHRDDVFAQVLTAVTDARQAEDVTAMVFLEAWRRRSAVKVVDGSLRSWLSGSVRDVVRSRGKLAKKYAQLLERLPEPEPLAPARTVTSGPALEGQYVEPDPKRDLDPVAPPAPGPGFADEPDLDAGGAR